MFHETGKTLVQHKILLFILALCLLLGTGLCRNAEAATLTLPANLKTIEAEAFSGDESLDVVVLPNGVTSIGSMAFADSGLTAINLPDSLTYIADDAFDGPEYVRMTANEGTYAYNWAAPRGYLLDAPVQKAPEGNKKKVTVNWNPVEGAASYTVYWNTADNIATASEFSGIEGTSYTIESLLSGTTYYTWVKAVSGIRISPASNMKSVMTYADVPTLNEPEVVGNTIALSWNVVTGAAAYQVYYGLTDNINDATPVGGITDTSYTITGLEYNTTYKIWVASVNGSGGLATKISVTTGENTFIPVQNKSTGLKNGVTVSWSAVQNAVSYNVYYNTENDIGTAAEITGCEGKSYTIENLLAGTVYYTWVKAVNAEQVSEPSNVQSVITHPDAPALTALTAFGNSISMTWNEVTGATEYRIRYNKNDDYSSATAIVIKDTSTVAYTITDLEYDTKYYIWIAAANSSGGERKKYSEQTETFTPVQNTSAGYINQVTVNWEAVNTAESYNVYYSTEDNIAAAEVKTGITGTTCTIENLLSGTVYYTWVKAVNAALVSEASNVQSVITYSDAPTLKTLTALGNSISMTWNEVAGATEYRIRYNTVDNMSTATQIKDIHTTAYTITDLEYDTKYYIWISSTNSSGGQIRKYSKTTNDSFTPVQNALTGGINQVTVNWTAVQGAAGYNVYYSTENNIATATEKTAVTGTSYIIENLLSGTVYYTWVKAVDADRVSDASNVRSVITYADAPELQTLTASGNSLSMTWNEVTGATLYRIRYNDTDDYGSATRIDNIRVTSYTITDLKYDTKYYIWISSTNSSGGQIKKYSKTTEAQ